MAQWMQRQPESDGRGSATGMMATGAPTATALMATGAPTATGLMAAGGASRHPVAPAQPGAMYGISFVLPPENRVLRIPEEDDYKKGDNDDGKDNDAA